LSHRAGVLRARVTDELVYRAYAVGWALVRRLPERAAYRLFERLADAVWRRRGAAVARLEANLRRARPGATDAELRALSRAGMRSYLRYWCDAFRLPDWDRARVVASVRVENEHHLREPLAAGRGVVAALMHMGNWDHAGAWASLTGAPVVTVAERLAPERLYARFLAYREGLGMEILPLSGGNGDLLDTLAQRLRAGRLVPLLADRDLRTTGIPVRLLGEPTRMPPGPALLALRTGAALHPVSIWFEDRAGGAGHGLVIRFHDEVKPPTDGRTREKVGAMTQEVADAFGAAITAHPEDWHMLQRLWLGDLDPERA
jgi:phosphatidylinositol dimannoside acyltransferase